MKRRSLMVVAFTALLGGSLMVGGLTSCEPPTVVAKTYKVTVNTGEFSVTGLKTEGYKAGEKVSFTVAVTNEAKEIDTVKAGTSTVTLTNGKYEFSMPESDVSIVVTLKDKAVAPVNTLGATISGETIVNKTVTILVTLDGGPYTGTVTITPTVGETLVEVVGNEVQLMDVGEVTLKIATTYAGTELTYDLSFTIEPAPVVEYDAIEDVLKGAKATAPNNGDFSTDAYNIGGTVVAISNAQETTSYVDLLVADATGIIDVNIQASRIAEGIEPGAPVSVKGQVKNYFGLLEFSHNTAGTALEVAIVTEGIEPVEPVSSVMSGVEYDAYIDVCSKDSSTIVSEKGAIIKYVEIDAVCTNSGSLRFKPVGSTTEDDAGLSISKSDPTISDAQQYVVGKTYTLKGYVLGYNSGRKYANMIAEEVTAKEVAVESITLSTKDGVTSIAINQTLQINAAILPVEAQYNTLTWTSSAENVATVSSTGLVTALAKGETTITAAAQGKSGTFKVIVTDAVATCTTSVATGLENGTVTISPEAGVGIAIGEVTITATPAANYEVSKVWVKVDNAAETEITATDGVYKYTTQDKKTYVFGATFTEVKPVAFKDLENLANDAPVFARGRLIALSETGGILWDGTNYAYIDEGKTSGQYGPKVKITEQTVGKTLDIKASWSADQYGHYISVNSYAPDNLTYSINVSSTEIAAPTATEPTAWGETELKAYKNGDLSKYVSVSGAVANINGNYLNFTLGTFSKGSIACSTEIKETLISGHTYNLKGYSAYSSGGFNYLVITEAIDVTPTLTGLTCKSDKATIKVNEVATLSATATPEGAVLDTVTYEITEGADFAKLDGSKLTGVKEGTVKVVAKAGSFTSEAITITVAGTLVPTTSIVKYDFSSLDSTSGEKLNDTTLLNVFKDKVLTGSNPVTAISGTNEVYFNKISDAPKIAGLKLSKSKGNGRFVMTTSANISKLTVTMKQWNANENAVATINGVVYTFETDGLITTDFIFDATKTINFSVDKRCVFTSLELFE